MNNIAVGLIETTDIIAYCGRDRNIQIFCRNHDQLDLFQTLVDHTANMIDLLFMTGTDYLISLSSDRTVSVRKYASGPEGSWAYVAARTIDLKASPVSFTTVTNEPTSVLISTMDKQIQRYDLSGRPTHSFKSSDPASSETFFMSSLEVHIAQEYRRQNRILIGVSSSDKSIMLFDYESGSLIAKEHWQAGVATASLIRGINFGDIRQQCFVTCGYDGTVMIWDLSFSSHPVRLSNERNADPDSPFHHTSVTPSTRRVICSS